MGVDSVIIHGGATAVSPPVSVLLSSDSRPLERALRETGDTTPVFKPVPFSRYFDREFARLEMEHVWKKCWQVVGREEDIPEVGDRMPYACGTLSYIIVRSGPQSFRALQNACLHRGTRLCSGPQSGASIKCPFHGWEWRLDGSLKTIPGRWDFPQVDDEHFALPEAKIDRWGGFLFINPDPAATPLSAALGVLPRHFSDPHDAEERFTALAFRKRVRANWKQVQEAFLEAYHLSTTHPGAVTFNGDTTCQYDIWDDGVSHVSRSITPSAVPSGSLGDEASALRAAQESLEMFAAAMPGVPVPQVSSAETGRAEVAQWRRQVMGPALGVDFSERSDSYMLDSTQYFMFPNFWPWFGEGLPLSYQFMPYGDDPNESVMEVRILMPVGSAGRPPAAEMVEIDFDTPVRDVSGMGFIAGVFDEDYSNSPLVQAGLRSTLQGGHAILGRYQESRIQAFHAKLDSLLGL